MTFKVLILLFCCSSAWAARNAVVDVDTDLFSIPKAKATTLERLKKSAHVTASNYPTEGFYKVRAPDGTLGWVKADTLELGPMPDLSSNHE